jgi:hypothetical protein
MIDTYLSARAPIITSRHSFSCSRRNHQPDRKYFRHSAFKDEGHQGSRLACGRDRRGLQADRRAQARWRAVNAPHLVALVRAGAIFHKGKLLERPVEITPAEPSTGKPQTAGQEVA